MLGVNSNSLELNKYMRCGLNDKRGHQLVPLKRIKGAPTHSIIYAMPTKLCMHAEWHKYYLDIKFRLNYLNNGRVMSCRVDT